MDGYEYLIQLTDVYDGWSIGVTFDGEYVNRWPEDDYRHAATQKVIDELNEREANEQ